MSNNNKKSIVKNKTKQLYLLTEKSIPSVMLEVLKVKDLIENKNMSVANASKSIGISRTTYYKYCNEVFYFEKVPSTKTINIDILIQDKVGLLSQITNTISNNKFNIITINQHQPIANKTKITISIIMTDSTCNLSKLVEEIRNLNNVLDVKITSIDKGN